MNSVELVLFFLVTAGIPAAVLVIYFYLRASFILLDMIRSHHPERWESLGKPEHAVIFQDGSKFHTIRPLFPWLRWIWSGSAHDLEPEVYEQFGKTRLLLKTGLIALGIVIIFSVALIMVAK